VKIENFEIKISGWPKKQHGSFSGRKLLADSKNVHVLYVWRSNLPAGLSKNSKLRHAWNF
jgi:hypothetical protein